MNQQSSKIVFVILIFVAPICPIAAVCQESHARAEEQLPELTKETEWSITDDGKIRLSNPPTTKDGRIRGNLNLVADRVQETLKNSSNIKKLYTMSTKDEFEVTIVLKNRKDAPELSRQLVGTLYGILLDSNVTSCKLVFWHGEKWIETSPRTSIHQPGPTVFSTLLSISELPKK